MTHDYSPDRTQVTHTIAPTSSDAGDDVATSHFTSWGALEEIANRGGAPLVSRSFDRFGRVT